MPRVQITEKGCRGCALCVDICPVNVFEFDASTDQAHVEGQKDCIGCLSCTYACPSQCIVVNDIELIRPFYRIEENVSLVEQFLQVQPVLKSLTEEEIDFAYNEVGILLSAFSEVIGEILGRGHKTVGRRAGGIAAAHLPEMYEAKGLEELLERLSGRFGSGFEFDHHCDENGNVQLRLSPCGLLQAAKNYGEIPGKSALCLLFHEYWSGMISTFIGFPYSYKILEAGDECVFKLEPSD